MLEKCCSITPFELYHFLLTTCRFSTLEILQAASIPVVEVAPCDAVPICFCHRSKINEVGMAKLSRLFAAEILVVDVVWQSQCIACLLTSLPYSCSVGVATIFSFGTTIGKAPRMTTHSLLTQKNVRSATEWISTQEGDPCSRPPQQGPRNVPQEDCCGATHLNARGEGDQNRAEHCQCAQAAFLEMNLSEASLSSYEKGTLATQISKQAPRELHNRIGCRGRTKAQDDSYSKHRRNERANVPC